MSLLTINSNGLLIEENRNSVICPYKFEHEFDSDGPGYQMG